MTQIKWHNGSVQVSPSGELDQNLASVLKKQIDEVLLRYPAAHTLDVNLKRITFMDSSGIGFLMARYRQMRQRGGKMRIFNVHPGMDRLFRMSGFKQIPDLLYTLQEDTYGQREK